MEILKVSTKSNPNSVAGALANLLKENDRVEVDTIGAGAINQGEIMSFEIYQADSKTGMQGSLIEETAQSFADGTTNYETVFLHP